jgi:hypothetical protein
MFPTLTFRQRSHGNSDCGEIFCFKLLLFSQRYSYNIPLNICAWVMEGHFWLSWYISYTMFLDAFPRMTQARLRCIEFWCRRYEKAVVCLSMSVFILIRLSNDVLNVTSPRRNQRVGVRLCDFRCQQV